MDGTILGQGTFVSNFSGLSNPNSGSGSVGQANPTIIQIPSNADWLRVIDYTQFGTAGNSGAYLNGSSSTDTAVEWYWQRGMPVGQAIVKYYANAGSVLHGDILLSGGFTLYDPSGQSAASGAQPILGAPVATTASTSAQKPVVSTSNTAGLSVGSVVRMSNTAQTDVNGIDMVVSAVSSGSSFTLLFTGNELATAPGAIGGAGFYRIVNYNPLFYPARRYVTNITQATNAQVSTSIAHNYVPGQEVRFSIPAVSGMIQLNPDPLNNYFPTGSSANAIVVSVVDAYNFTININTSAMTAFTWPTIAQQPSSFPIVAPIGEDTATALASTASQVPVDAFGNPIFNANSGILSDATVNTGYLGMILGAGGLGQLLSTTYVYGPAGSVAWTSGNVGTGDTLYWVAGKSTYGGL